MSFWLSFFQSVCSAAARRKRARLSLVLATFGASVLLAVVNFLLKPSFRVVVVVEPSAQRRTLELLELCSNRKIKATFVAVALVVAVVVGESRSCALGGSHP